MRNAYREFLDLLPPRPLQVGTVSAVNGSLVTIDMPGGGSLTARGDAEIGQRVFVRDGVVEGEAAALTHIEGEV